jgi:hypothetical protein
MTVGISDTWVDGFEAYVLVEHHDIDVVARCFGVPMRWWPRAADAQPDRWWLCKASLDGSVEAARRPIQAYLQRESGRSWVMLQSGQSNADTWAVEGDGDYHGPMYRDAIAACSLQAPKERELHEAPVTVAARVSDELRCRAIAMWGSDEEPALEGICLIESGRYVWAASTYSLAEVEAVYGAYESDSEPEFDSDEDPEREGRFFLYRPGVSEALVEQPLQEWADQSAQRIGAGMSFGYSPNGTWPDDFPKIADAIAEFTVAIRDERSA